MDHTFENDPLKHAPEARNVRNALIQLSPEAFINLGMNEIAYVREIDSDEHGHAYAIHAANGAQISVLGDRDLAFALIRHNDLKAVTVH